MLLTTHYLEEAEALADRVAIMRDGAIAVNGTLGEVAAGLPSRISFRAPAIDAAAASWPRCRVDGRIGEHRARRPASCKRTSGGCWSGPDGDGLTLDRLHAAAARSKTPSWTWSR